MNATSPSRRGRPLGRAGLHALVWLVGLVYVLPLLWMFAVSLKSAPGAESARGTPVPRGNVLGQAAANYAEVWNGEQADFPRALRNSALVAVLSVAGMVVSSALAAYGFSRLRWRGREALFLVVLVTMMIPPVVVMPTLFVVFKKLGWIGTFAPLWAPCWLAAGGGFSIFLLRQFFLTIPRELDEAARIDGCSHWGVLWRVILPNARPALAVVALMQFVASWNDFLGPLLFLNHPEQYTLSLGLQMYQSQHGGTPWNLVMAFSVLVVLPVMVLYVFARRFFVEGVAATGIKE